MAKRKQLYYKKLTMNGMFVDNKCPECEGDGVDFLDYTNARGGKIEPRICELCDGQGIAVEGKDFEIVVFNDHKERQQIDYKKLTK